MQIPNPLENFKKRATTPGRAGSPIPTLKDRPIVTNSRIKQGEQLIMKQCRCDRLTSVFSDEQFRKDIHLTFVTSALQQKAQVS